jgi:ribosomal protein S18 acetylase RimI-like enzyme
MSAAPSARAANATVRDASWADAEPLSQTLARAFADDPLISHFMPDPARRAAKLPRLFRLLLKLGLPYRACHVTSGYEAATFWRPPNKWHLSLWDYVANGPGMLSIFGGGALRVMNAMDFIEKRHPREPHWYLQTIGTDPAMQSKGYGSLVMRHQLAIADAERKPCYLESSKDTNVPIYQSFGFRLTGEIALPSGPTIWPMWRDPVG